MNRSLTVIFDVGIKLAPAVLILQDGLEFHTLWLLGAERLHLGQSVLPVELPTLLLPIVVGLHLFLLAIIFLNLSYFIDCVLALFLWFFCQLYEFLNFSPDCLILFINSITKPFDFFLDLAIYLVNSLLNRRRALSLLLKLIFDFNSARFRCWLLIIRYEIEILLVNRCLKWRELPASHALVSSRHESFELLLREICWCIWLLLTIIIFVAWLDG